jgi:hypothetical protein
LKRSQQSQNNNNNEAGLQTLPFIIHERRIPKIALGDLEPDIGEDQSEAIQTLQTKLQLSQQKIQYLDGQLTSNHQSMTIMQQTIQQYQQQMDDMKRLLQEKFAYLEQQQQQQQRQQQQPQSIAPTPTTTILSRQPTIIIKEIEKPIPIYIQSTNKSILLQEEHEEEIDDIPMKKPILFETEEEEIMEEEKFKPFENIAMDNMFIGKQYEPSIRGIAVANELKKLTDQDDHLQLNKILLKTNLIIIDEITSNNNNNNKVEVPSTITISFPKTCFEGFLPQSLITSQAPENTIFTSSFNIELTE